MLLVLVVLGVALVMLVGFSSYAVVSRRRRVRRLGRDGDKAAIAPAAGAPAPSPPAPSPPAPSPPATAPQPPTAPPMVGPGVPPVAAPEVGGGSTPGAVQQDQTGGVSLGGPSVVDRPRFRDRLGKARALLGAQLAGLRARTKLDREAWEELEEALILADVGVATVEALLQGLKERARNENLAGPDQLVAALREELVKRLQGDRDLHRSEPGLVTVWLFVGVNGVGKTTTIGKVAMREVAEGNRVVMAAGDTFRAAAADQLLLWSERVGAGFVRGNEGGDPGAVVFDAVQHAAARGVPLVLADTAGRLHTKVNLMEELKKVRRVADRAPGSVAEVLLVIDATTGQNGLVQARQFTEAVKVTGVVLTKLDGTAKGGIAVAIASELGIPIKLVGLGEGPEDLVGFDAQEFVDALLPAD